MRETFLKEINNKYKYSFGADVEILFYARKLPDTKYNNYLCTETKLNGKAVIEFVKTHAPYHADMLSNIVPDGEYIIYTFDD